MGDNCDNCGNLFKIMFRAATCTGCNSSWCLYCDIEHFIFNEKCYCFFCWEPRKKLKLELPENTYYCCTLEKHICANTNCEHITLDTFDDEELPKRGICCVTYYEKEEDYCRECYKITISSRVYTWLLIGKTLELPKDIRIMIGKMIWEK
jgi:hypothetical protein